ncbi:hypothetical protein HDU76_007474 [Blyttiomyces sp. JEL0837]|nr:hypothetical protein HDU76_007474 [Blyttiomyces sp. JEL0837]
MKDTAGGGGGGNSGQTVTIGLSPAQSPGACPYFPRRESDRRPSQQQQVQLAEKAEKALSVIASSKADSSLAIDGDSAASREQPNSIERDALNSMSFSNQGSQEELVDEPFTVRIDHQKPPKFEILQLKRSSNVPPSPTATQLQFQPKTPPSNSNKSSNNQINNNQINNSTPYLAPPNANSSQEGLDHAASSGTEDMPMSFSPEASGDFELPESRRLSLSPTEGLRYQGRGSIDARSERSRAPSVAASNFSKGTSGPSHVRRVIAVRNESSNKRLRTLFYSYTLCLLILVALAIFQCTVYRDIYNSLTSKLNAISDRANAAIQILEAADMSRSVDLARVSGWWFTSHSTENASISQQFIMTAATGLKGKLGLFASLREATIVEPDGSILSTYPIQAVSSMLDSLLEVAQSPLYDPNLPTQIQLVLDNVPYGILDVMNASILVSLSEYSNYANSNPTYIMANATIGPILCLFFQIVIVFPLYVKMERDRQNFLRMFYDIPKNVVRGIYESNYQRLQAAEEEDSDDENEFSTRFAIDKGFGSVQDLSTGDTAVSKILTDSANPNSQHSNTHHHEDLSAITALRNWFLDQHRMAIKSLIIFGLSVIFFFTTAGLTYAFMGGANTVGNEVFWSAQRPMLMEKSTFLVREAFVDLVRNISSATPSSSLRVSSSGTVISDNLTVVNTTRQRSDISNAFKTLDSLSWTESAVVYGDPLLNFAPVSDDSTTSNYRLELVDACTMDNPSDCESFMNGVMTRGLRAAIGMYNRIGKAVLTNIVNGALPPVMIFDGMAMNSLDSTLGMLRLLHRSYIKPSLNLATTYYSNTITNWSAWFSTFNIGFTVAFVVLLALIHLLVIQPLIKALAEDVRRTSALVYMLPSEVMTTVPSFKQWSENETYNHGNSDGKRNSQDSDRANMNPMQKVLKSFWNAEG